MPAMRNVILSGETVLIWAAHIPNGRNQLFPPSPPPFPSFPSAWAAHHLLCSSLVCGDASLFQELSKLVQLLLVWPAHFIYLLLSLTTLLSWLLFPFWEVLRNKRQWRWWWRLIRPYGVLHPFLEIVHFLAEVIPTYLTSLANGWEKVW